MTCKVECSFDPCIHDGVQLLLSDAQEGLENRVASVPNCRSNLVLGFREALLNGCPGRREVLMRIRLKGERSSLAPRSVDFVRDLVQRICAPSNERDGVSVLREQATVVGGSPLSKKRDIINCSDGTHAVAAPVPLPLPTPGSNSSQPCDTCHRHRLRTCDDQNTFRDVGCHGYRVSTSWCCLDILGTAFVPLQSQSFTSSRLLSSICWLRKQLVRICSGQSQLRRCRASTPLRLRTTRWRCSPEQDASSSWATVTKD